MLRIIHFSLVVFIICFRSANAQVIDSAWSYNHYHKENVYITMRDGIKLYTTVYSPNDKSEFHPILMMRTPYSVAPYGTNIISPRLYTTYWRKYLEEGYILVMQDVRGRYMSEGKFMDVRPFNPEKNKKGDIDEASDAYDTIDWLINNIAGNNQHVGVFGVSYPGFYATMAAASRHPNLKAVSPQAPVTDWFIGDDFHHNGAFALMDGFSFYYSFGKTRLKPGTTSPKGFEFPEKDAYSFHLKQGPLKNYKKLMGDSVKFWDDLMQHPNYDTFWQMRDARKSSYNLNAAMLVVGGTFDAEDCYGAWNLFKAISKQSPSTNARLVMGPWFHGGWGRSEGAAIGNVRFGSKTSEHYQNNIEVPFFNHYLKLKGKLDDMPKASVFFSGENNWRASDSWPPNSVEMANLYLHPNQKLSFDPPVTNESYSKYISDPQKPVPYADGVHLRRTREYMIDDQRFASKRPDVLVFVTNELENDLVLAGPVMADLMVNISTTDADFVVKLIDVYPDDFSYEAAYCCKVVEKETEMAGYQMLVRAEIMRGRFRNSFERPEPFVPGKTAQVKFELPDVAHTFKKGHKLMVHIQSSWFPLFDRNPQQYTDIYTCDEDAFISSEIKIYHDITSPSSIWLPVLKKSK